jgi:hypothetical protein
MVKDAVKPKRVNGISRVIQETKEILELTGRSTSFGVVVVIALGLMVLGCLFAINLNNLFLLPVLSVGFALIPFWFIIFTATSFKKGLHAELETALSIITSSYLRTENIIIAIEDNISYLNPPVVQVFENFLAQAKLINSNLKYALEKMKGRLQNEVFDEWVSAVIACQDDKTLKSTLTPIVKKLQDIRVVSSELEFIIYDPLKEWVSLALLLVGNVPLLFFLNRDWYHSLVNTIPGKAVMAFCAACLFLGAAAVIRQTRPLEYKR